jgi:putative Holliday junction resolvase
MRILAVDFGERHIGLATADDRVPIAVPLETVDATDDPVGRLERAVNEEHADLVVFGLPLSISGAEGSQALRTREIAEALAERITVPIEFEDERFTSAQAESVGARRKSRKDAIAASIFLQSYMDRRR